VQDPPDVPSRNQNKLCAPEEGKKTCLEMQNLKEKESLHSSGKKEKIQGFS
jgi:hypothetical protein